MKSCTQCGAAASDGALKCPVCKAWLVAVAPPGGPGPALAAQPPAAAPAASWSPPASSAYAPEPVGAYQVQSPAYPAQAPAYQGQAPAYDGQAPAYGSVAVADADLMPRRAAAPSPPPGPATTGSWSTSTGAWPESTYSGQHEPRNRRLSLRGLPNITWDRRRAKPFIAGGCAIVVALAGLWFFVGRGHGSHAPAARPKTAAKAKPHGTAKQRAQANGIAQKHLRAALTAEKVAYVDNQTYLSSPSTLRRIEPSLAWGTRVKVKVGDASTRGDRSIVCISETTRYGDTWTIADVANGTRAGTYSSRKPCPARLTPGAVAAIGPQVGGGLVAR